MVFYSHNINGSVWALACAVFAAAVIAWIWYRAHAGKPGPVVRRAPPPVFLHREREETDLTELSPKEDFDEAASAGGGGKSPKQPTAKNNLDLKPPRPPGMNF